jgi:hypothetical protein
MSTEQEKILRAKVNMETSRIAWKELQKFFAGGAAVEVSPKLDLVEVAYQMHSDNKTQFKQWLESGLVGKVTDEKALVWLESDTELWAVVVSPWVLVQDKEVLCDQVNKFH